MEIGDLVKHATFGHYGIIIDVDDYDCVNPEFHVHWITTNYKEWRFQDELGVIHEDR